MVTTFTIRVPIDKTLNAIRCDALDPKIGHASRPTKWLRNLRNDVRVGTRDIQSSQRC